ncbi:MAG: helix-turn-helix transcriptional regulator [Eggerthellaceae bacterium]|nr:helix-turn-helix transcriptional regulator [Eggerthellaceae bacterium]
MDWGLTVADDVKSSGRKKRIPEWRMYGDPRNIDGHFRPKRNLRTLYGKGKLWTRESLAEAMGINDPSVISKWVSGKRYMSDEDVVSCAMAAGVSVTWLLDLSKNPSSQGWPAKIMVERQRIQAEIKNFSKGKTWNELAEDYHAGVAAVKAHHKDIEDYILSISKCKDIEEFERMKDDEADGFMYQDMEEHAYGMVAPPPWDVMWFEDEDGYGYQEEIDVGDVERYISKIERLFPGDHRELVHLAHVMLDDVMKYYPSKCLEELTGLLNQASRMRDSR